MLKCTSVDISCVQDTAFRRQSISVISVKAAEYKLFLIGNENGLGGVGIFFAKNQMDKVTDFSKVLSLG